MTIKQQIDRFWKLEQQIDDAYEDYAKSVGLSYTGIYILNLIYSDKIYTQKELAELLFLPKQTINSIISNFCKQGILELVEFTKDKRHKIIHITSRGTEFMNEILPKLEEAEIYGLEQLSISEREQLVSLMERYAVAFVSKLKK